MTGAELASFNETGFGTYGYPNPRDALSPEELERYAEEGAAMSLDETIAYAFETLRAAAGTEPAAAEPGASDPSSSPGPVR